MTTQQIIENEQKSVLIVEFAKHVKALTAENPSIRADIPSNNAGAIVHGDSLCSFVSDNSTMDLYFCKQGELSNRRGNPDQTLVAVPLNASSMCFQDQCGGIKYNGDELARHCIDRLVGRAG